MSAGRDNMKTLVIKQKIHSYENLVDLLTVENIQSLNYIILLEGKYIYHMRIAEM